MKFGYELDGPSYDPHYIEATCFADAVTQLESKFNIPRLAGRKPDTPWVEVWEDKGVARKDMSFADLSGVYNLHPDCSGFFKCRNLCTVIWNELCNASDYIDNSGKLTADISGFTKGMNIEGIFKWLDDHTSHGVRSLIFGIPNSIPAEPVYVPCKYVSSWDGFGDVISSAKYDPVNNLVYDVETADLSEEELAECEILAGEYMELLGSRFSLGERSDNEIWQVEEPNPFYVISGMSNIVSEGNREEGSKGMETVISCEIGAIVYGFAYPRTDIVTVVPEKVEAVTVTEAGVEIETDESCYSLSDFGKRVFLTKEDAEAAVALMKSQEELQVKPLLEEMIEGASQRCLAQNVTQSKKVDIER